MRPFGIHHIASYHCFHIASLCQIWLEQPTWMRFQASLPTPPRPLPELFILCNLCDSFCKLQLVHGGLVFFSLSNIKAHDIATHKDAIIIYMVYIEYIYIYIQLYKNNDMMTQRYHTYHTTSANPGCPCELWIVATGSNPRHPWAPGKPWRLDTGQQKAW